MLKVERSADDDLWYVVNTFDGVIVGEFYTRWDAEDFAAEEVFNECRRIQREYGLG